MWIVWINNAQNSEHETWERVGREKLLLRCRLLGARARRFGAHGEERGGGISWRPPAYSLLTSLCSLLWFGQYSLYIVTRMQLKWWTETSTLYLRFDRANGSRLSAVGSCHSERMAFILVPTEAANHRRAAQMVFRHDECAACGPITNGQQLAAEPASEWEADGALLMVLVKLTPFRMSSAIQRRRAVRARERNVYCWVCDVSALGTGPYICKLQAVIAYTADVVMSASQLAICGWIMFISSFPRLRTGLFVRRSASAVYECRLYCVTFCRCSRWCDRAYGTDRQTDGQTDSGVDRS